ncbi:MAG: YvcK family protein [Chloroflexia bacterium]|nr:YvcK family protein [Chloroflexia bacterium]
MDFWKWFVPGIKIKRWLALLFGGIVLLALGVAYVLVHFYRTAPFPGWVYWITLQFIDRPWRAAMFLLFGVGLILLALQRIGHTLEVALVPEAERSLADVVYQRQRSERGKRVVVIGASTGTVLLLRALRQQHRDLHVRVISTGLESSRIFSRMEEELRVSGGRILFPTREDVAVYAELQNGLILSGLDAVGAADKPAPVQRVFLGRKIKEAGVLGDGFAELVRQSPLGLEPAPEALQAIEQADLIILGPASLYTGILPCLTPPLAAAIQHSRAALLFACNVMTEPGQTESYSLSDHLRTLKEQTGVSPDYVLVNAGEVSERVLDRYRQNNAEPLLYDPAVDQPSSCLSFEGNAETILVEGAILLQRDLVAEIRDDIPVQVEGHREQRSMVVIRHDVDKLSRAIAELMERQLDWGYSA